VHASQASPFSPSFQLYQFFFLEPPARRHCHLTITTPDRHRPKNLDTAGRPRAQCHWVIVSPSFSSMLFIFLLLETLLYINKKNWPLSVLSAQLITHPIEAIIILVRVPFLSFLSSPPAFPSSRVVPPCTFLPFPLLLSRAILKLWRSVEFHRGGCGYWFWLAGPIEFACRHVQ
jgi:hypothetical protein